MKKKQTISIDKLGMCASGLCIVHCLAVPVLLVIGLDSILWIMDNPLAELLFIGATILIGSIAFLSGYRVHRQNYVPVLFIAGALLIVNGESVATEWLGVMLSVLGAGIIVFAHFHNYKLRRHVA